MNDRKYFKVLAKCGHVGRKNYVPIAFAVIEKNRKKASKIVRDMPRVKHNHKDAILSCEEISYEEYLLLHRINENDPYLKCHSSHEQKKIDLSGRLVYDPHSAKSTINNHKERTRYKEKKNKCLISAFSEWGVYTLNSTIDKESDEYENNC